MGVITSTQWPLKTINTSFIHFRDILLSVMQQKQRYCLRKEARFTLAYRLLEKMVAFDYAL